MKKSAALAASLLFTACGNLPNILDSGNGGCNCSSSQVCHPVTNKCVATCMTAADCMSASQSCTALSGTSAKTCTCASDNMCGLTEVCQGWSMCDAKCTGSSSCPTGYDCDTVSGRCSEPGTDGGTDGGTSCVSSNQQPDNCGYGRVCQTSGACQDAQKGTCSNFPAAHSTANWTPANGTGPVIYEHVDVSPDSTTFCAMGSTSYTVTLRAYTTGTFPAQEANLPGFKYVTTTGTETDLPAGPLLQSGYTVSTDMKHATMTFTLCSTTAPTSITAGFYFTGGNPYCATLMHQ